MKKNIIALVIGIAFAFCMGFGIGIMNNHININPSKMEVAEHILDKKGIEYDEIIIDEDAGFNQDLCFTAIKDGEGFYTMYTYTDNYKIIWE